MIVHKVIKEKGPQKDSPPEHKRTYLGCAASDIRYRDMMTNFRQRWEFYTHNTFDFITSDMEDLDFIEWKRVVENAI